MHFLVGLVIGITVLTTGVIGSFNDDNKHPNHMPMIKRVDTESEDQGPGSLDSGNSFWAPEDSLHGDDSNGVTRHSSRIGTGDSSYDAYSSRVELARSGSREERYREAIVAGLPIYEAQAARIGPENARPRFDYKPSDISALGYTTKNIPESQNPDYVSWVQPKSVHQEIWPGGDIGDAIVIEHEHERSPNPQLKETNGAHFPSLQATHARVYNAYSISGRSIVVVLTDHGDTGKKQAPLDPWHMITFSDLQSSNKASDEPMFPEYIVRRAKENDFQVIAEAYTRYRIGTTRPLDKASIFSLSSVTLRESAKPSDYQIIGGYNSEFVALLSTEPGAEVAKLCQLLDELFKNVQIAEIRVWGTEHATFRKGETQPYLMFKLKENRPDWKKGLQSPPRVRTSAFGDNPPAAMYESPSEIGSQSDGGSPWG